MKPRAKLSQRPTVRSPGGSVTWRCRARESARPFAPHGVCSAPQRSFRIIVPPVGRLKRLPLGLALPVESP
jgi:hypothetical protein